MSSSYEESPGFPCPPQTPPVTNRLPQPIDIPPYNGTSPAPGSSSTGDKDSIMVDGTTCNRTHPVVPMGITDPITPAPSPRPRPTSGEWGSLETDDSDLSATLNVSSMLQMFTSLPTQSRMNLLSSLLPLLNTPELLFLSSSISPRLKRDFLKDLPLEISLHILSFVDSPKTLARASAVSKFWRKLLEDEWTWKEMCERHLFGIEETAAASLAATSSPSAISRQALTRLSISSSTSRNSSSSTTSPRSTGYVELTPVAPHSIVNRERISFSSALAPVGFSSQTSVSPAFTSSFNAPSTSQQLAAPLISHRTPIAANEDSSRQGSRSTRRGSSGGFQPLAATGSSAPFNASLSPSTQHVSFSAGPGPSASPSQSSIQGLPPLHLHHPPPPASVLPSSMFSTMLNSSINSGEDTLMADMTFPTFPPVTTPLRARASAPAPSPGWTTVASPSMQSTPSSSSKRKSEATSSGRLSSKDKGKGKKRESDSELDDTEDSRSFGEKEFSYKRHFKRAYLTESNWLRGGRILSTHTSTDDGVVTSLAVDSTYIVIGMANCKIHVFLASTGQFVRTLVGHELGVWCLTLVTKGGQRADPPAAAVDEDGNPMKMDAQSSREAFYKTTRRSSTDGLGFEPGASAALFRSPASTTSPTSGTPMSRFPHQTYVPSSPDPIGSSRRFSVSTTSLPATFSHVSELLDRRPGSSSKGQTDVCGASKGWGQEGTLIVSGGCDRDVRVWDADTGVCKYVLRGHTSTIRCLKIFDGRPVAVSGSRDHTLRVWDIEKGVNLHVLAGHAASVRCIEINGNRVVSGSYDCTCRIWDVDTGECLFVLQGHYHQIYAVAFDGDRIATGSLDSTVRVWSAETGECLALLQGHTSLVGQLQLTKDVLVTGGSDGRVITFSLATFECLHRLCAHDNSVTCLQFDDKFIVTGGNDGRVKLWDLHTGQFIRELSKPCEAVWRVTFKEDKCVVLCKRGGKTVMEVLTFRPLENEL